MKVLRLRTILRALADTFRSVAYWLDDLVIRMPPTPEEQAEAIKALNRLRAFGAKMKKRGVTTKEIIGWVREGRR